MKLVKFICKILIIFIYSTSAKAFFKRDTLTTNNTIKNLKSNPSFNKLSNIFRERDPTKTITKSDFLEAFKFSLYNITRGEAEQIFIFSDSNKDNFLDLKEWDKFKTFFIIPFENCDKNSDYLLDVKEFTNCWNNDQKTKLIELKQSSQNNYKTIMKIVSSRGKALLNFADYLFIRKTLFAWEHCHSFSKYISKEHFACAIKIIIPQQYNLKMNYEKIYNMGIELTNNPSEYYLDYIYYLRISFYTYFFSVFSQPSDGMYLDKINFIKGVKEDRLPNKFEESEINIFYDLISNVPNKNETKMSFETFTFFYHFHRLFVKYSKSTPRYLSKNEISALLDDVLFPVKLSAAIDLSRTNFTKKQYSEASLYFQKQKSSESDFYFGFRQISNSTKDISPNKNILSVPKNPTSRYYFFKIMSGVSKLLWSKYDYYHTLQLCNLYVYLSRDYRFIVSSQTFLDKMQEAYDMVIPVVNNNQRANFNLYKLVPKEVYFDLLTFLSLENFNIKVNQMNAKDDEFITETQVKLVMKEYGMSNIADDVIDIAKKKYDIMKRRVYDKEELIKVLIIMHSIANEQMRTKILINSNKLKKNHSIDRTYPIAERRLTNSYFIGK